MIWLSVIGTLIRELVRAWIVPARLLLYLPQRHRWRRRAQEALSAATERSEPAGTAQLEAFFARQPARSGDRPHTCSSLQAKRAASWPPPNALTFASPPSARTSRAATFGSD